MIALNLVDSGGSDSEMPLATGPRECECVRLQNWAESLSLPAAARSLRTRQISVSESAEGFVLIGRMFGGEDYDLNSVWDSFREAGHDAVRLIDEADHWSATFFEGGSRATSPWIADFVGLGSEVEIRVRVRVEGVSPVTAIIGLSTALIGKKLMRCVRSAKFEPSRYSRRSAMPCRRAQIPIPLHDLRRVIAIDHC